MRSTASSRSFLLLALPALAGGLALAASGCYCHRHAAAAPGHPGHHGHASHHAGKRGGCNCGHKGHHKHAKKGCKKKHKKLGAPKLLCARLLAKHAPVVGLSAEQVAKLGEIQKAHQARKGEFRLAKKRILVALRAEWLKDQPDSAQIRKLAGELAALKGKMIAAKADYLLAVQKVLTPAQYKKLLTLRPHKGCAGCRHGKGGPKGHGHGHPGGKPCRDCVR